MIIEGFAESETRFDSVANWMGFRTKAKKEFDGLEKIVLEFKASLIAASSAKRDLEGSMFAEFVKNIQPISVGV